MRRKQNFESVFSRKFRCRFVFYLLLSPLPASFAFLSPFFFSFVGHLLDYLLVGKDFAKRSRIVNFFGRKYQWVVGQDFHWNFLLKVTRFFASFSGLFD